MSAAFWLQKLLLTLLLPPASLFLLALCGALLLHYRRRHLGRICVVISGAGLLFLSISPLAGWLIAPLENQYPPLRTLPTGVAAVVVLTGGTLDLSQHGLGGVPDGGSTLRLSEAIRIQRQIATVPLVVCGGRGDPARPQLSSGRALANLALALGVTPERLLLEEASHNTLEGAREVKRLLLVQGETTPTIILVTSAFHMGRSVRFFTEAGFKVVAAPTDFYAQSGNGNLAALIPSANGLGMAATAVYEYLARLRYALPF